MLIYNVRHMLVHIRKYSCNCAESMIKEIIDIINMLEISYYVIIVISLIVATTVVINHNSVEYVHYDNNNNFENFLMKIRHRPMYQ